MTDDELDQRWQYYAVLSLDDTPDDFSGIARRADTDDVEEVFERDLRWHPTGLITLHDLNLTDEDLIPITTIRARDFLTQWRAQKR